MTIKEDQAIYLDSLRRRVRLVMLIDGAENAGLSPFPIRHLHMFAFLSNVLAPVWDMPILDGKLLKRRGGPFYAELQRDLDTLVGIGVATVSNLDYILDEQGYWRLEGSYKLNREFANRILRQIDAFESERTLLRFLRELALALSSLTQEDLNRASTQDATYADPIIDFGSVVDFAEWQTKNYTAAAANWFERLVPGGVHLASGEKLHMYLRHVQARIHGAH